MFPWEQFRRRFASPCVEKSCVYSDMAPSCQLGASPLCQCDVRHLTSTI